MQLDVVVSPPAMSLTIVSMLYLFTCGEILYDHTCTRDQILHEILFFSSAFWYSDGRTDGQTDVVSLKSPPRICTGRLDVHLFAKYFKKCEFLAS